MGFNSGFKGLTGRHRLRRRIKLHKTARLVTSS